jgi:PncC family amidohydrolase
VYTKEHKAAALGVDLDLLKRTGSVTEEVAQKMAQGALTRSVASVALSVTGVLGPEPDEDGNPPGTVIIAVCQHGKLPLARRFSFDSDHPDEVRRQTVLEALNTLQTLS